MAYDGAVFIDRSAATGSKLPPVVVGEVQSIVGTGTYGPGGTDVPIADGGTGASTASAARTNLGLGTLATVTPTGVPDGTKFLRDDGVWIALSGSGAIVSHGSNPSVIRPEVSGTVVWIGSVLPGYSIDGDRWDDTSGIAPTITTTTLGSLNVGVYTSQQLMSPGTVPINWTVKSGDTLPAGLQLSSTGELFGTPTTAAPYNFTVNTLSGYGTGTQNYTNSVGGVITPVITTIALDGALKAGTFYSKTLMASGSKPVTWSIKTPSGSETGLPAGLSLAPSTGIVSGTPTNSDPYSFTAVVTYTPTGVYSEQAFSGSVSGSAPAIGITALNPMSQGASFSQYITHTGTEPIAWRIRISTDPGFNSTTDGALPAGLSLDPASGRIYGTPTTAGPYSFTVIANNAYSPDATQLFAASIASATPAISTALSDLPILWRGIPWSQAITMTGALPVNWDISAGALPAGLSIDTTSHGASTAISGSPTTVGTTYDFTVRATHATYGSGTKRFNPVEVKESTPNIVETSFNTMGVNQSFTQTLTGTPSGLPLTWSHTGTPPAGLTWNDSTHTLSGTPTTPGSWSGFSVRLSNGVNTGDDDVQPFSGNVNDVAPPAYVSGQTVWAVLAFNQSLTVSQAGAVGDTIDLIVSRGTAITAVDWGGTPMTQIGTVQNWGSSGGNKMYVWRYKVAVGNSGTKNINIAQTGSGENYIGAVIRHNGSSSSTTPTFAADTNGSASSGPITVGGGTLAINLLVAQGALFGTYISGVSGGTLRATYDDSTNQSGGVRLQTATADTTFAATVTSGQPWAMLTYKVST